MLDKILPLSEKLVSIRSHHDNPRALQESLDVALSCLSEYQTEVFEENGVKSALIYNSPQRPKKFKVILNGHLDVIPGKDFQYSPKIKGNKLFGVGSMDMKSSVACLIMVFKQIAGQVDYPLGLQLVTDEEVGGFHGTKFQVSQGVKADFVIAGESTSFNIVNKAKGVLWIKISTQGKSAHGAYTWNGDNAVWKMNQFLNALKKKFPTPQKPKWGTTINLSSIETNNTAWNKVPDYCAVKLDIRYIPEDDKIILKSIKNLLPAGFKLQVIAKEPALWVPQQNRYLQALKKVTENQLNKKIILYGAHGSSDARHFTAVGSYGIEFGPIGAGLGTDNEWIDIKSLEKYCQILKQFLLSLKKE